MVTNAGAGIIPPTDPNIQYVGRWDKSSPSQYTGWWGGAYLRVSFTGTTVKVNLAPGTYIQIYYSIDGGDYHLNYPSSGVTTLTWTPLSPGTHTLTLAQPNYADQIGFQGLTLDSNAVTVPHDQSLPIIEFVGNSITSGFATTELALDAFPWLTGEGLGCEHTQISYSGVTLSTPCSSWHIFKGMNTQYFKMQIPPTAENLIPINSSTDWNFDTYTPKAIVINLGTNDPVCGVSSSDFQAAYTSFLADIRAKLPSTEIFAMLTFCNCYPTETQAAVTARNAAGDTMVHFINTQGWLSGGDYSDGLHPNENGHKKVANNLIPILRPYINLTTAVKHTGRESGSPLRLQYGKALNTAVFYTLSGRRIRARSASVLKNGYAHIRIVNVGAGVESIGR